MSAGLNIVITCTVFGGCTKRVMSCYICLRICLLSSAGDWSSTGGTLGDELVKMNMNMSGE